MIIDTFLFNKDFNALRIRLAELYDVVDLFVISESRYTFTGKRKNLFLTENMDEFEQYSNKIKIVVNTKNYRTSNPWVRDHRQRQLISKYLKSFKLGINDLIIHSDCDEIPRSTIIRSLRDTKKSQNILLELINCHNYINLTNGTWKRGRIVTGDIYKSINKMTLDIFLYNTLDFRRHRFPFYRVPEYATNLYYYLWKFPKIVFKKPNLQLIKNAGWHFNNLFSFEDIIDKIQDSSHVELNTNEVLTKAKERHSKGLEIYSGAPYILQELDNTYPKFILENLSDWSEFILD